MVLESLGVVKAATALKGAAIGLAAAVPPLITNSALATQQLVEVATPVAAQGVVLAGAGLTALGVLLAKGTAAAKAGIASLAAAAAKGSTGAAAAKSAVDTAAAKVVAGAATLT